MPLIATRGAASAQGFGEFGAVAGPAVYIEDVFSTYLYTGNGSTQTITNGIDLSGKGGLVWIKNRTSINNHALIDTSRGAQNTLKSDATDSSVSLATVTSFNANGFSLGSNGLSNANTASFVSWTFRKAPKFFDVVTYTGNGATNRTISHNLQSTPGCVIIKRTDTTSDWIVWHTAMGNFGALDLNQTYSQGNWLATGAGISSTTMQVGGGAGPAPGGSGFLDSNTNGGTYVAYLFAHNAGGFGLTGTDNVISCGSYTGTGAAGNAVTLGYEPQWLMVKKTTSATQSDWVIFDNMRGMPVAGSADQYLFANASNAEGVASTGWVSPTATGFQFDDGQGRTNGSGQTYIYIAIRRGPMKTPTSGTSVFTPATRTGTNTLSETISNAGFPVDLIIGRNRALANDAFIDRLRGLYFLRSDNTDAEAASTNYVSSLATMAGWISSSGGSGNWNTSPNNYIQWYFRRAPGFFDEVCYTGNGPGTQVINHNLTVVPELVINKVRSTTSGWTVFQGDTTALTGFLRLNETSAAAGDTLNVSPTTITVDSTIGFGMNTSGQTYVTYLFASCPGVSKVGRFTGTGATQVINCGFTGGARFVLIKARSTTGDWYVWDSARGIVAGNDPYLELNTTDAEVTGTDWVDTASTGFELSNAAGNLANSNGVTYIFLAIA